MFLSIIRPYRDALSIHGAAKFSAAGFLARLPLALIGLGVLLYISNTTGSYSLAGFLQAVFVIAAALAAIISSRMSDRYGQRIILIILPSLFTLTLFLFVYAVSHELSRVIQTILVVIAGATFPSFGSLVRTRWAYVTDQKEPLLHSAFAWESVLDEAIFTIGPIVAVALAFNISFASPILVGAVITLVGSLLLARLGESAPPPSDRNENAERGSAIRSPGMIATVFVALGIGTLFGTMDVAVVAFMQVSGTPQLAGLPLALFALCSMIGGFIYGSRHFQAPLPRQLTYTVLITTVIVLPLPFIGSAPVLIGAIAVSGFAVAPTLIVTFSLAQRLTPPKLLTEGLTWTNSGLAAGFAFGASLSGFLVDRVGTQFAFGLAAVGSAISLTSVLITRGNWNRAIALRGTEPTHVAPITLNQDPIPGPAPGAFMDNGDSK
ncbi:MAG: MFS transporter [Candidatus Nanopelagicales bacterium]|nr:MFS transporter [Candidatus Nanopelagicales bacterium]